jgi:hypothetical protein
MVYFQTKNSNLGKFWSAFDRKMLIYFMAISNILRTFWIIYAHLVYFVFIWYIFPGLVPSGNPVAIHHLLQNDLQGFLQYA